MSIHAKKLQRRFDRGESINKICNWYLHLEDAWAMPFRDLEPVEQELIKYMCTHFRVFLQQRENPGSAVARTSTGSRLATILDQHLADTKHPLLDVARWYSQARLAASGIEEKDLSDTELAAWNLGGREFKSETEINPRNCACTRPDPKVCMCRVRLKAARTVLARAIAPVLKPVPKPGETLPGIPDRGIPNQDDPDGPKLTRELAERALDAMAREVLRARGDKVVPQRIDPWPAMLLLAPQGNELAQILLAWMLKPRLGYDVTPMAENIFQDRRYATLLFEAFNARPDYAGGDPSPIIRRW
jgi:hypothetical protein